MATTVTKEALQLQQGPPSSSAAEDESLKRNTDCVYYLASPLTCKKGAECEYRHSEYARMNPTDCWYWMNGNCLNPKCSFRHPPLDGLVGNQVDGPSALVPPGPPMHSAPQNPAKQGVPCIFFQRGQCLKADRCPYMHGPSPPNTKIQQAPSSTPTPGAHAFKKAFSSLEKCTQPQMNFQANKPKVVETPHQANAFPKNQSIRPTNGATVGKGYLPPSGVTAVGTSKYGEIKPPVDNGNSRSRTGRAHHGRSYDDHYFQNGRDADDSLRESSPGFDVLVDNKVNEDEFYHNEDQYAKMRGRDGRNLNEFDIGRQDDYGSVADVEPEIYHNRRGYDSFDRMPEKYARDHRRVSSERSLGEPAHMDRRGPPYKSESLDVNQNSDLRHRLSKHRRVNGLKSVVNSDYSHDDRAEDRGYRSTRRDSRRSPIHESSRGHRLQGRIKLPRKSSPVSVNDIYSERESERGRSFGRLSPSRQQVSGQPSRLRDRLSGIKQDESREGRMIKGPVMRKDTVPSVDVNFAGPKSLSELKGTKHTDSKSQQLKNQEPVSGGKLRDTVLASSIGTEGNIAFAGPKPLSEILKRKRTASTGGTSSDDKEEIKDNENDVNLTSSPSNSAADTRKQVASHSADEQAKASKVENKILEVEADEEEGEISNKKIKSNGDSESPSLDDNKQPEAEEALVVADGEEHEFDEEYDHGDDGEYEYEQDDGEGYHLNDGETGDLEEEFMDEDDGDDFAKKLGVSF
ncbi:zinc finger CCCH domain-containing protein 17-like [Chenopodium quinoa]|uniref:zinc finger CCCH domain-containing protein 17-like n=1 Tax=Chenopodium quinoa TaxID=63459 RepID=UPI000B76DD77|nr:zinc finger CCCH domain-containing protein 17-like [Chenopodium quinoa]